MAKTSDILLSEVKWPDVYVRGKKGMNEKHVTDLTLTLKDSDGKWPFPAIIVRPLKAPVAVDPTVAGKPGKAKYELVDGWHRCMAAVEARWKSVPAEVIPMTDAEAALSQLVTNIAHGERLSQEQKYEYIAYLRNDLHIKVETIAKQTGMSIASVSRIATGKQHVPKSKDGKKRKDKGKKHKKRIGKVVAAPEFFEGLGMMVKAFSLNPESILSQRKMVDPELLAKAHDMTESLLTHPEVEEPGGYDPNVDGPDREAFEAARRNGE